MLVQVTEISCLSFAFLAGIIGWRRLTPFLKALFIQVLVWIGFYSYANVVTIQQQANDEVINTQWLMNIHLVVETGLLLWAARFRTAHKKQWLILLGAIGFIAVYCWQVTMNGFEKYLHHADLTECIVITVVFTPVLFNSPAGNEGLSLRMACIALLIYFACSVPYVSLMNYLQHRSPELNSLLYHIISDILANLRYALIALAFVFQYRNNKNERIVK